MNYPLYVFSEVDKFDKVLDLNHFYIEVPVTFGYRLYQKFELQAGYSFRYYLPTRKQSFDFINNSFESGIVTGLSVKISDKSTIGILSYIGSGNIYSEYVNISTTTENLY